MSTTEKIRILELGIREFGCIRGQSLGGFDFGHWEGGLHGHIMGLGLGMGSFERGQGYSLVDRLR